MRRGEPGKACNSCEKPSDLPFLTLQQPTRKRFTTAGEGEKKMRRKEDRGEKKDGQGRRRHKQRTRGRNNEINRERRKDRGAEGRCDKAREIIEERKINRGEGEKE